MMMVTARTAHFLEPVVQTIGRKLTLKQVGNGTVLVGGGHRADHCRRRNGTGFR